MSRPNEVKVTFKELSNTATDLALSGDSLEARCADIKLIEAHMPNMNETDKARARATINAIRSGQRRYNYEIKPIGQQS